MSDFLAWAPKVFINVAKYKARFFFWYVPDGKFCEPTKVKIPPVSLNV